MSRFIRFFGLAHRDGNFCYGCIGIPEEKYDPLKFGLATLLGEYQQISRMSGGEPKELEFSPHFLKLPKPFERRFGLRQRDNCTATAVLYLDISCLLTDS
jgi:hypothetical protein